MSQVELTTLGKSCEFFNGKAHEKSIDENGNYIVVNSKFISQEGRVVKRTKEQMFPLYKDDIVMVMSDVPNGKALAKCFIIDQDDTYSLNQRICCIRSKEFDTKYLYYQLNRNEHFLTFNNGENQTNLRKDDILDCPLIKPSMDEQKRMVAELDEAFTSLERAINNIETNISNSKELYLSELAKIFNEPNWPRKKLNQIALNFDSKRIPITQNKRTKGNIPYYGASGIVDYVEGYIFDEDLLLVSEDGANLLMRTYPIAFSISGKNWVNNHAHVLKFDKLESQRFVEYYLNSIRLDEYISGMAQPKLNQAQLNKIPIPFPDFNEQVKAVNKLDVITVQTNSLTEKYIQKREKLEELKSGILKRAFENELIEAE